VIVKGYCLAPSYYRSIIPQNGLPSYSSLGHTTLPALFIPGYKYSNIISCIVNSIFREYIIVPRGNLDVPKIKQRVNDILTSESQDRTSRLVMLFLSILIVLNVLAVILGTVESLQTQSKTAFAVFETFSVIIFSIEYLLRVWSCTADTRYTGAITGRIKYILHPWPWLICLPFFHSISHSS